jgi:hypothetical protein
MRSWQRTGGVCGPEAAFLAKKAAHAWNESMGEQIVRVECYAGYKGDERPVRIVFAAQTLEIASVEDRWYSPGETYFRLLAENGDRYVLRRHDGQEVWSLTAYRQVSVNSGRQTAG